MFVAQRCQRRLRRCSRAWIPSFRFVGTLRPILFMPPSITDRRLAWRATESAHQDPDEHVGSVPERQRPVRARRDRGGLHHETRCVPHAHASSEADSELTAMVSRSPFLLQTHASACVSPTASPSPFNVPRPPFTPPPRPLICAPQRGRRGIRLLFYGVQRFGTDWNAIQSLYLVAKDPAQISIRHKNSVAARAPPNEFKVADRCHSRPAPLISRAFPSAPCSASVLLGPLFCVRLPGPRSACARTTGIGSCCR